jgi:hypothetical protein
MKKSKIKENAALCLAANKTFDKIFMTSNGQGYTDANVAQSRQNSIDASKKVLVFGRDILVEKSTKTTETTTSNEPQTANTAVLEQSVPKLIEALKTVTDTTALQALLEAEKAKGDDTRSTAVKAIEDRIADTKA